MRRLRRPTSRLDPGLKRLIAPLNVASKAGRVRLRPRILKASDENRKDNISATPMCIKYKCPIKKKIRIHSQEEIIAGTHDNDKKYSRPGTERRQVRIQRIIPILHAYS